MTQHIFLYGRLCDPVLFSEVSGVPLEGRPGKLAGASGDLSGLVVEVDADALRRLSYFMSGGRAETRDVLLGDGPIEALPLGFDEDSGEWSLAEWQAENGPLERLAAAEYMRMIDTHSGEQAARAMPQIRMRAASLLRARAEPSPSTLVPETDSEAVRSSDTRQPYTDYFAVREDHLTFPRFGGGDSAEIKRASFLGGDAVTVLPYDPVTDSILVVRQFRHGPYVRGDTNPWTLEPAAGRIDPGETPEDAAQRELMEETGVASGELHFIGRYYPSPGAYSEYLYSYVAVTDLSGRDGGVGGLEDEAEDIMAHVIGFEDAMAMIESGETNTAPLILSLGWLAVKRRDLG